MGKVPEYVLQLVLHVDPGNPIQFNKVLYYVQGFNNRVFYVRRLHPGTVLHVVRITYYVITRASVTSP